MSSLKSSFFYLADGQIFIDKQLPDPEPAFLSRVGVNSKYSTNYFMALHNLVTAQGYDYPENSFNFQGARIPLAHTKLVIPKWRELLETYPKKDIVDKLEFGFPIGTSSNSELVPSLKNHSSSYMFYSWIDKFCISEIQNCGLTGPFSTTPFQPYHLSPMMTALKKPNKRRPVFDASYGLSINKCTPKEFYLEEKVQYDYPTLDDFQLMILKTGVGSRMWKRDLSRFFLQIPICPSDYPKTGFIWRTNYFFFVSFMFGLCHAGLAGQNITSAVNWIHRRDGQLTDGKEYNTLNYSDDIAGVEEGDRADVSFKKMGELLATLGLEETESKATAPSTCMTYLGVTFDSITFKKSVPPEKVAELLDLLGSWLSKQVCSKRSLQSLCGKLLWITRCVRHSRVFLSRLLSALKTVPAALPHHKLSLSEEMKLDIKWWFTYLRTFNGVDFMIDVSQPTLSYKGDACVEGGGGYHGHEYWSRLLPPFLQSRAVPIHLKEFWVLLVSIKLWGSNWSGQAVELFVDNTAVCQTCSLQKPSDASMAAFLREFLYLVVHFKFHPIISHIGTKENFVADFLSRNYSHIAAEDFFHLHNMNQMSPRAVPDYLFKFSGEW